jgi:hypothetical protein
VQGEGFERVGDGVESSRRGLARQSFALGEPLLDRVEIGALGRQVEQTGFGAFDGRSDALYVGHFGECGNYRGLGGWAQLRQACGVRRVADAC